MELAEINEQDILDALSGLDGVDLSSNGGEIRVSSTDSDAVEKQTLEVDSSNINDVASLLEKLMNNKTLEVSIKIKS